MKTICIVQARCASTRLPNKVMMPICGKTVISYVLRRLQKSTKIDQIIVATTNLPSDDALVEHVQNLGFKAFRGSEHDVLNRYVSAAKLYEADVVVRITADCPLIDHRIVDTVIDEFLNGEVDYVSNISPPTFPDGMDVEVFNFGALEKSANLAAQNHQLEHVTIHLRDSGLFKVKNITNTSDLSDIRLTVDTLRDYKAIVSICEYFYPEVHFDLNSIVEFLYSRKDEFHHNLKSCSRNEGMHTNNGQKLWQRAKTVIPAGNMLLSKRPEMFLPEHWPAYYTRSEGCNVWDLDGNKYTDMCLMGVGTNILGYAREEVDDAVKNAITAGNMTTLNCPEEIYLAEKLISMHPFAEMARFCRTGGEANTVALRLARAATGKETVAICGYHGWHDWYLSANLVEQDSLQKHLLPGLSTTGVAKSLRGSTVTFEYNRIDQLKRLISENDLAAIKMEVIRNYEPENMFLHEVRKLATENNIVLIFDECTSGFRETFGGIHSKYGVEPDLATFGKAMGNGYAITAVIGTRAVMETANDSFISSTFWTEKIGNVAALKTIEIMERDKTWDYISAMGCYLKSGIEKISQELSIPIAFSGIPALAGYSFAGENALKYKTLISQELLKKGYLASTVTYISVAHTKPIVDLYLNELRPVFQTIKGCEDGTLFIDEILHGPVCHNTFSRLN